MALCLGSTNTSDPSYLLYPDGVVKYLGTTGPQAYFGVGDISTVIRGKGLEYSTSYQGNDRGIRIANGFLGTIFNLDETVTKSASQSMKITYTLTNE